MKRDAEASLPWLAVRGLARWSVTAWACPMLARSSMALLFERFTDPDRSEYPDIDIDICQDGRQEILDYVRDKYGHVAQIITFGTLKARAAHARCGSCARCAVG